MPTHLLIPRKSESVCHRDLQSDEWWGLTQFPNSWSLQSSPCFILRCSITTTKSAPYGGWAPDYRAAACFEDIWKSFSSCSQDLNGSFIAGRGPVCWRYHYCALSGVPWTHLAIKRPFLPKSCFLFCFYHFYVLVSLGFSGMCDPYVANGSEPKSFRAKWFQVSTFAITQRKTRRFSQGIWYHWYLLGFTRLVREWVREYIKKSLAPGHIL